MKTFLTRRIVLVAIAVCSMLVAEATNLVSPWSYIQSPGTAFTARQDAASFTIGDFGYIVGGFDGNSTRYSDMWAYNNNTGTWSQKASYPSLNGISNHVAVYSATTGKAYAGTGWDGSSLLTNKWHSYDPINNTWTKLDDFANYGVADASIVEYNGDIYVAFGEDYNGTTKDMYKYETSSGDWMAMNMTPFPGDDRSKAIAFRLGNNIYMGGGVKNDPLTDFYLYNAGNNTWTSKDNIPLTEFENYDGFAAGGYGFITGTQHEATTKTYGTILYYDEDGNDWASAFDMSYAQMPHYCRTTSFVFGDKIVIGTGVKWDGGNYYRTKSFWSFNIGDCLVSSSQSIDWTGFYACQVSGSELESTRSNNSWCNGAVSTNVLKAGQDGSIELASVKWEDAERMFGFTKETAGGCTLGMEFGLYIKVSTGNNYLQKVENGVVAGTIGNYSIGDQLVIEKDGSTINYYQNGNLLTSSTISTQEDYRVYGKIYTAGKKLEELTIHSSDANAFLPNSTITWQTNSRMDVISGVLTAIGSSNWCNGTESIEKTGFVTDFGYRYIIPASSTHQIIGFSTTTGNCYGSTEYGFMLDGTYLQWIEGTNRANIANFSAGDIISMECDGTTLTWKYNCTVVRQVQISRTSRYHLDAQLYYNGTTLGDLYTWGLGSSLPRMAQGISTAEEINVSLAPNPSNGIFAIESSAQIDEVLVYNASGALISTQQQVGDSYLQLDIANNPSGMYIVRIKAGEEYFTKKLIVR